MKKTLVVSYLPGGERSVTKKLLNRFLEKSAGKTEILHRDLMNHHPPIFDETSLVAYHRRGYGGETLTGALAASLEPFDELISEIKAADHVVFAFPMHNYSVPGVVKSYLDAILLHGDLFRYTDKGPRGLLPQLRVAVFYASGGIYEIGHPRNIIHPVMDVALSNMGVAEKRFVNAAGTLAGPEVSGPHLDQALGQVEALVADWYGGEVAAA